MQSIVLETNGQTANVETDSGLGAGLDGGRSRAGRSRVGQGRETERVRAGVTREGRNISQTERRFSAKFLAGVVGALVLPPTVGRPAAQM